MQYLISSIGVIRLTQFNRFKGGSIHALSKLYLFMIPSQHCYYGDQLYHLQNMTNVSSISCDETLCNMYSALYAYCVKV